MAASSSRCVCQRMQHTQQHTEIRRCVHPLIDSGSFRFIALPFPAFTSLPLCLQLAYCGRRHRPTSLPRHPRHHHSHSFLFLHSMFACGFPHIFAIVLKHHSMALLFQFIYPHFWMFVYSKISVHFSSYRVICLFRLHLLLAQSMRPRNSPCLISTIFSLSFFFLFHRILVCERNAGTPFHCRKSPLSSIIAETHAFLHPKKL